MSFCFNIRLINILTTNCDYLDTDLMESINIPPIIENANDIINIDEKPVDEIKIAAITGAIA